MRDLTLTVMERVKLWWVRVIVTMLTVEAERGLGNTRIHVHIKISERSPLITRPEF